MRRVKVARILISFYGEDGVLPPEVETRLEDLAAYAEYEAVKITRDFPALGLKAQVDEE